MAQIAPFVAASPKVASKLEIDPRLQALWRKAYADSEFKDIWGGTWTDFMGITDGGGDGGINQIGDNPGDYNRAYTADAVVYRCVDIRGAAIASVPLGVYDGPDPDQRKPVAHEALDVLQATNPLGWVAGPQLLRYSLSSRDLHGHFAWRFAFDRRGLPREIYWMQPEQYKAIPGQDLRPPQPQLPFGGLKIRENNQDRILTPDQVLYSPTHNIRDPLKGMSRITALRNAINLKAYGEASNIWFFQNNQRPDLLVTGAFNPTVENVSLMRRIWRAAFGGDHQRGPAFLPHDMSVHLLTTTAKDAEWLGQQNFSRETILAAFGIPPPVYGDLARATYENIRTAYENFWRTVMIAELDEIAWFITQQFLWRWDDARRAKLVCCFDYSQIEALNDDANAIWERFMAFMDRVTNAVRWKQLTPNQSRVLMEMEARRLGLPPEPWTGAVPGGDQFYVRLNEIPVKEASVQANIDVMAARAGDVLPETHKPGNGSWTLPRPAPGMVPSGPSAPTSSPGQQPPPRARRLQPDRSPQPAALGGNGSSNGNGRPQAAKLGLPEAVLAKAVVPNPVPIRDARLQAAQDWMTRRFKRYFQDQQTVALRTLRKSAEAGQEEEKADAQSPAPDQAQQPTQPAAAPPPPATAPVPQLGPLALPPTPGLALPDVGGLWDLDSARDLAGQIVRQGAGMAHQVAFEAAAQDYGLKVAWEPNEDRLARYMGSRLHFVQNIDETTRKAVRDTLLEGAQAGEGIPQLAQRVRNVFAAAIDYRATRIARTETIQAYGYASLEAYRQAGLSKARMFDGPNADSADCINVDGQVVSLEEAQRLMREEHPNGTRAVAPVL